MKLLLRYPLQLQNISLLARFLPIFVSSEIVVTQIEHSLHLQQSTESSRSTCKTAQSFKIVQTQRCSLYLHAKARSSLGLQFKARCSLPLHCCYNFDASDKVLNISLNVPLRTRYIIINLLQINLHNMLHDVICKYVYATHFQHRHSNAKYFVQNWLLDHTNSRFETDENLKHEQHKMSRREIFKKTASQGKTRNGTR